jgi:hypothetical protein
MKKNTTVSRNCKSARCRKVVFTFLLFFSIFEKGLHAQNIYFKFSNSTYTQYHLSDIRNITFTASDMNLKMVNGSIVTLPLNSISNFNYTGFSGNTNIAGLNRASGISVYPNPGKGELTLDYNARAPGNVSIDILSTNGVILNTVNRQSKEGNNEIKMIAKDFEGKDLPPGIYLCRIRNSEESSVIKIIISK